MYHKFGKNDIFYNQIKAHPNINFKIYDGQIYYNNQLPVTVPNGQIDIHEFLHPIPGAGNTYPFITKDGSLTSFKTVSTSEFNSDFSYGDIVTGSYPLAAGISIDRYVAGVVRSHIDALRNIFNNKTLSKHFTYESSLGNKSSQEITLIGVPSIFYGSSIRKGSVSCKFYVTGTLAAELTDDKGNGELRQKLPQDSNSGSVAGVVLYREGFISLTGSWTIHPSHQERYDIHDPVSKSPRWTFFGTTGSATPADLTNVASSSFEIDFEGTTFTPVITMFAHAQKGQLNFSNNPTFLKHGQTGSITPHSSSTQYRESDKIEIKNIVKSNFIEPTGSFDNVTYLSRVGIYDRDRNLIAIAKLASPIRKRETDSFSIKMKIDT